MSWLNDRRTLAGLGAAAAVVLAVGAALLLGHSSHSGAPIPPTESSNITGSSSGGLKVEMGKAKVEADTSVRCFVKGQFVGMQTAADCASKNGVAPGGLDVGLDESGAIAAGGGDTRLQPIARSDEEDDQDMPADTRDDQAAADPTAPASRSYASAPPSECRRYAGAAGVRWGRGSAWIPACTCCSTGAVPCRDR